MWVRLLSKFQYTRPCGRDQSATCRDSVYNAFQYTRPCGRDRREKYIISSVLLFQYTRPCGRDFAIAGRFWGINEFQYTRPCGRDEVVFNSLNFISHFNTLAHAGETRQKCGISPNTWFQYTRPCGRDLSAYPCLHLYTFQYTRPCGRDLIVKLFKVVANFNTLAHAGETVKKWCYTCVIEISIHSPMRARHNFKYLKWG